jgi:hypothetical protein
MIVMIEWGSMISIWPGLCPEPHFILWLDPKNETRKIKTKRTPGWSRHDLYVLSGHRTVRIGKFYLY